MSFQLKSKSTATATATATATTQARLPIRAAQGPRASCPHRMSSPGFAGAAVPPSAVDNLPTWILAGRSENDTKGGRGFFQASSSVHPKRMRLGLFISGSHALVAEKRQGATGQVKVAVQGEGQQ